MSTESYLFNQGTLYHAYNFLGCNVSKRGFVFRVWAPNARQVNLVGDFSKWEAIPMLITDGIWEVEVGSAKIGDKYKFEVVQSNGKTILKTDPFGKFNQFDDGKASIVWDINGFNWSDNEFISSRGADYYERPINIYEVHIDSWKRHSDGRCYTYRELADTLIPYTKDMGFTHIELMPITEYPFAGSWGYQVTGYFAPSSRFGTPQDLMYFVNECHRNNIAVLLDWVPAHFPKDSNGLFMFDGTPCYEYADPLKQQHKDWGTMVFDYGKTQIQSFLVSSAMLFIKEYHFDGIRVDAVASMLYLDYCRKKFRKNVNGGRENLEAIAFFRKLNEALNASVPYCLTIAEESTSFPLITMPTSVGGLGFNLKWNMGWMNDTLSYFEADPLYRQYKQDKITFPLCYAFSERFVLPLSHDEVVHGKKSLVNKVELSYDNKFSNLRCLLSYQMTQPGKKLNFMGSEFGQFIEWDYKQGLDWLLLDYDRHLQMKEFSKDINNIYLNTPSLYKVDDSWNGFKWIVADDNTANVVVFKRMCEGQQALVVCNFSDFYHQGYILPPDGEYKLILNSDDVKYGGKGLAVERTLSDEKSKVNIPPISVIIYLKSN